MRLPAFLLPLLAASALAADAPPSGTLRETFDAPLSADWFWGLGTWAAKDGVLRGFESGPRRHGPVKVRKFPFLDATLTCDFRLEGKADFAGVIFNGSQERGHLFHVVVGRDRVRLLAHPKKGETLKLVDEAATIAPDAWHSVKIVVQGATLTATIDGRTFTAEAPCIAEEKQTFGLSGDSGGPDGEKAGALEFRRLEVAKVR